MLCKHPTVFNRKRPDAPMPCGQCMACRTNKRRVWAHRVILESQEHDECSFLTLTYDDDHLPDEFHHKKTGQIYAPLSVSPYEHKQFINKLQTYAPRKLGKKIRYYGVGEYGEQTQRPHFHYALFGYPSCPYRGASMVAGKFQPCLCPTCKFISDIWGKGNIFLGSLTAESANYVAGYVMKKMTRDKSEYQRNYLQQRHPEFPVMSTQPGIGFATVDKIASLLTTYGISEQADIPRVLAHGVKLLPLGRYLTDKIYEQMGITFAPKQRLQQYEASLRSLLSDSKMDAAIRTSGSSMQIALQMLNAQLVLNLEKKTALYRKATL